MIDVIPAEPKPNDGFFLAADTSGANENSALGDLLMTAAGRRTSLLAAGSEISTGGYVPIAPAFRGTVDRPASSDAQSGRLELRGQPHAGVDTFLRGNVLNDTRGNGTTLQTDSTRLWRYAGGGDADGAPGHAQLRVFGSRETYAQSFTAISAGRGTERLTRLQAVPVDEFGVAAQAAHTFPAPVTAALGVDGRDIRAHNVESPFTNGAVVNPVSTSARQREVGGFADAIWQPGGWSLSGSLRVDSFRTFDARQTTGSTATRALPEIDELLASPHLGVVRSLPGGLALTANAFRAFRGPTMNELYRTGQVGQQTTLANNSLQAERATGFEFGGEWERRAARLRATYFWTEVNRPVSAVLLSQTATTQTLRRENLGQIRSRGVMLEATSARWRGLQATVGYQLAIATVTRFDAPGQPSLVGNWIPQVPRESVTASLTYVVPRVAVFHLLGSYTGQQFDDSSNQFALHPYARFDLQADRAMGHGFSLFAGAQNLLNRSIDAGRTPILTLASPRLVQAGVRFQLPR